MTKQEILKELQVYFDIRELVSEQVYKKYGESKCWCFFNSQLLETLLILRRDILGIPMTINNWASGGSLSQRGLRANKDPMVAEKTGLYLSAHCLGSGLDFSSSKKTADEIREIIVANQEKLPYPIRLEDGNSAPGWVHFDLCGYGNEKIEWFKD